MAKKIYRTLENLRLSTAALAVASCLALSGLPLTAHAAGLGKVTVFSALGQPLRAEVDISASREELSGMKAQLASPDAFKQAGLDYATTLLGIKFVIDKRANGQSIIKLSSDKPINDPFVDMLLELNWPSGRLVREYTFLLDPPEVAAKVAAQVTPAVVKPLSPSKPVLEPRATPVDALPLGSKPEAAKPRAQEQAKPPAEGIDSHQVIRGDTLRKIASEVKPEGVSLDQMLVGLFRANQDAFDGGNMNRLKAGKILSVPEKSALEAVSEGEAKKVIVAQSSDWNAYRRKLAGIATQTMAKEDAGKQESTGKITARVEDKAAAVVEPKDQLKVSKTEAAASKASAAAAKRSEEDLIAKDKALREANDRLASLEKNVADLQKLVELKNQNLAELQKQAAAKAAQAVEAKKPEPKKPEAVLKPQATVVTPTPVEVPAVPEKTAEKPVEKPVEKPAESIVVKPQEAKPEVRPVPKAEEMPQPKPKPVAPPPPPEEPGFIDALLDNPLALAGAGGILALLAGFIVAKRRRTNPGEKSLVTSSTLARQSDGLTGNSIFRSTGGQSVDTSHTPAQTDFSQAGPGSIDTDEVDPVAEADVYMAYGRDAQAEEILLEAKTKDSKRYAIHLKLLEIYANRESLKQFESLATELYSETGGVGAEWEKAAAMGLKLDPENPLYGGAAQAAAQAFDADATIVISPQNLKNTVIMPAPLLQPAPAASPAAPLLPVVESPVQPPATAEAAESSDLMSLDFDLGMGDANAPLPRAEQKLDFETTVTLPEVALATDALDFDFGGSSVVEQADTTVVGLDFNFPEIDVVEAAPVPPLAGDEVAADLSFDVDFDAGNSPAGVALPSTESVTEDVTEDVLDLASVDDSALEFDVNLSDSTILGQPMQEPSFDMSSISLDLADTTASVSDSQPQAPVPDELPAPIDTTATPQPGADLEAVTDLDISPSEEVATKLDLAKAYEEMGDLEGARELLKEVLKEGDARQQERAKAVLAKIGE